MGHVQTQAKEAKTKTQIQWRSFQLSREISNRGEIEVGMLPEQAHVNLDCQPAVKLIANEPRMLELKGEILQSLVRWLNQLPKSHPLCYPA